MFSVQSIRLIWFCCESCRRIIDLEIYVNLSDRLKYKQSNERKRTYSRLFDDWTHSCNKTVNLIKNNFKMINLNWCYLQSKLCQSSLNNNNNRTIGVWNFQRICPFNMIHVRSQRISFTFHCKWPTKLYFDYYDLNIWLHTLQNSFNNYFHSVARASASCYESSCEKKRAHTHIRIAIAWW